MMNFRTIKDAIVLILGTAAAGRFNTIGFQRQVKSASEVESNNRLVQVYYSSGDFPKSSNSFNGFVDHNMTFRIEFTVSEQAQVDLTVINNPESTAEQKSIALAALGEASDIADQSVDELFDIVYNIIMDARNIDLGLTLGINTNRWIDNFQKNDPIPRGELVVLTASCNLSCKTTEEVLGDTGTAANEWDTKLIQKDDPNNNAGAGQY